MPDALEATRVGAPKMLSRPTAPKHTTSENGALPSAAKHASAALMRQDQGVGERSCQSSRCVRFADETCDSSSAMLGDSQARRQAATEAHAAHHDVAHCDSNTTGAVMGSDAVTCLSTHGPPTLHAPPPATCAASLAHEPTLSSSAAAPGPPSSLLELDPATGRPRYPAVAALARLQHWRRCSVCGDAVEARLPSGFGVCGCGAAFRWAAVDPLVPCASLRELRREFEWQAAESRVHGGSDLWVGTASWAQPNQPTMVPTDQPEQHSALRRARLRVTEASIRLYGLHVPPCTSSARLKLRAWRTLVAARLHAANVAERAASAARSVAALSSVVAGGARRACEGGVHGGARTAAGGAAGGIAWVHDGGLHHGARAAGGDAFELGLDERSAPHFTAWRDVLDADHGANNKGTAEGRSLGGAGGVRGVGGGGMTRGRASQHDATDALEAGDFFLATGREAHVAPFSPFDEDDGFAIRSSLRPATHLGSASPHADPYSPSGGEEYGIYTHPPVHPPGGFVLEPTADEYQYHSSLVATSHPTQIGQAPRPGAATMPIVNLDEVCNTTLPALEMAIGQPSGALHPQHHLHGAHQHYQQPARTPSSLHSGQLAV